MGPRMKPLDRETAIATLGEGFHASLRKGSDHPESGVAWKAIERLPSECWEDVLEFLVDGLDTMGVVLAQKMDETEAEYVHRRTTEMVEADHGLSRSDAGEEAVAEWDRKRHAGAVPPLLSVIFDSLLARGWQSDGQNRWRHPEIRGGRPWQLQEAILAQTAREISDEALEGVMTEPTP